MNDNEYKEKATKKLEIIFQNDLDIPDVFDEEIPSAGNADNRSRRLRQ